MRRPALRVRIERGYAGAFFMDLGQRNAVFVKRPLVPLRRFFAWADAFALLPEPDYDIVHSFNAIPLLTRRPYLVTFEDFLPRVPEDRYIGWLDRWLRTRLLEDQCAAIIAASDYARRQFHWQHRGWEGRAALERKMHLIYPGVPLARTLPKRPSSSRLKLIFVGGDFMRKGGPAVLRAHERLRRQGIPAETVVISLLPPTDYVAPRSDTYRHQELRRLHQEGITFHRGLPQRDTLRLLEEADYLLFPTLHDTFGLISAQALACGTPALVTATGAQPEIVQDGRSGFLLPLENDPVVGKWVWLYRQQEPGYLEAYDQAIERLAQAMTDRLRTNWPPDPARYEAMSAAAIEQAQSRFRIEATRERLEQLYEATRERRRRTDSPRPPQG